MSSAFHANLLSKAWGSLVRKGPIGLGRDAQEYLRWRLAGGVSQAVDDTPQPISNWDLNQQELHSLPEVLQSRPILVYAEASTRCNLHCFMCRLSFPETTRRVRQNMTLETFAKLEPLLEPGSRLSLFGLGEPLMNPQFVEMLRIAKERGVFVGLNSNAMLLAEPIARAMVELQQDLLMISFSGGTKVTYERVITGANYERVIANLRRLNEIKLSAVSDQQPAVGIDRIKPVLELQYTLMRDNLNEVPEAVRLAIELRCAGMVVMPLTVVNPSLEGQSIFDPELRSQAEQVFEAAREVAASASYPFELQLPDLGAQHQAPGTQHSATLCHEPWQTFYVRDDGTVNTCCYSNRVLGDLKEQGAMDVWNGELYQRFRARMRSDDRPAECRVCHKLCGGDEYDQRVDDGTIYDQL